MTLPEDRSTPERLLTNRFSQLLACICNTTGASKSMPLVLSPQRATIVVTDAAHRDVEATPHVQNSGSSRSHILVDFLHILKFESSSATKAPNKLRLVCRRNAIIYRPFIQPRYRPFSHSSWFFFSDLGGNGEFCCQSVQIWKTGQKLQFHRFFAASISIGEVQTSQNCGHDGDDDPRFYGY